MKDQNLGIEVSHISTVIHKDDREFHFVTRTDPFAEFVRKQLGGRYGKNQTLKLNTSPILETQPICNRGTTFYMIEKQGEGKRVTTRVDFPLILLPKILVNLLGIGKLDRRITRN